MSIGRFSPSDFPYFVCLIFLVFGSLPSSSVPCLPSSLRTFAPPAFFPSSSSTLSGGRGFVLAPHTLALLLPAHNVYLLSSPLVSPGEARATFQSGGRHGLTRGGPPFFLLRVLFRPPLLPFLDTPSRPHSFLRTARPYRLIGFLDHPCTFPANALLYRPRP